MALKLGSYTVHVVKTGTLRLDGGAMFGIVPRPLWEKRIAPDAHNRIPLQMRCLLLEGDGRLVLVDNGMGDKYDAKFADIFGVDHETDTLQSSLRALGVAPADITDVILTHLHFDHCGGSTYREGADLKLTFPNARHHVQRRHWEWAMKPNARERASFLSENLLPIQQAGALALLDGAGEPIPGVEVRVVEGHTEAQQIVLVRGREQTLAYVADLLPTVHHLAPAWNMGYDVRPMETMAEKATFLDEAVDNDWWLFFEHDPEVEMTSLARTSRGIVTTDHREVRDAG